MELKPRFQHRYPLSITKAEARLQQALDAPDAICKGAIRDGFIELSVREDTPRFWSPQLRARFVEHPSHTLLRGRFAPQQETWTMFIAIYAAVVFSTGVGAVFGFAQYTLGSSPWALWSLPIGTLLVGCVWLGARLGQQLGSEDMQTLRDFVQESATPSPSDSPSDSP